MLFRKLIIGIILISILSLSDCAPPKGGIVILDNPNGMGFTMDFNHYNEKNRCQLYLTDGDTLQVEVTCDSGKIALTVSGRNGSEPYSGNDLESGIFTFTVSETDKYVFRFNGRDATGKVTVRNLRVSDH